MISDSVQQQALSTLVTVRDYLRWGESMLRGGKVFLGHGYDDPWDEALALLMNVLHFPVGGSKEILDARLLPDERTAFVAALVQRVNDRRPTPYITRESWFCGLPFYVDERVLIPRSPLSELIEHSFQPWVDPLSVNRVLDLCTGSGCIAIACAYAFPDAQIDASDISPDALEVCAENIRRHECGQQVTPVLSDSLNAVNGPYDLIVSNPPYVDAQDMASMPHEYRHEPALALESGDDGLAFTRQLLGQAADFLSADGVLIVEVGNSFDALITEYPEVPFFWFEFERGGHGVFMLTRDQLVQANQSGAI